MEHSWEKHLHLTVALGKPACQVLAEGINDVQNIIPEAWIGLSYNTAWIHFLSEDPGFP